MDAVHATVSWPAAKVETMTVINETVYTEAESITIGKPEATVAASRPILAWVGGSWNGSE